MDDTIRAALVNVIKATRMKMSRAQRSRGVKTQRWLYPLATETRYGSSYRAWVKPMIVYVHNYIKENHEEILRGDSTDFRADSAETVPATRLDAVPGKSFKVMIDSLNGWLGQYVPEDNESVSGSAIYMGLGKIADSTFDFNEGQFEKGAKSIFGIEFPTGEDWWPDARDTWANNNYQIIRSDMSRYISQINTLTEQAVTTGATVKTLREQIRKLDDTITQTRADFIARDQIGKLNGQITQMRQESIGLTMYVWETAGDERVRSTHVPMDGRLCRWDDSTVLSDDDGKTWVNRPMGAVQLHPGMDYQCRCTATAYWQELVGEADAAIAQTLQEPDTLSAENTRASPPQRAGLNSQPPRQEPATVPQGQATAIEKIIDNGMAEIRRLGKNTGVEHLRLYKDDGTNLGSWKGKKDSVTITSRIRKVLNSSENNSIIMMHNHPNNSSFSLADLDVMSNYESIKELRIIGHNGQTYRMAIGKGQRVSLEELVKFEESIYTTVRTNIGNKAVMGVRTNFYSERNRLMAEHYGWVYEEGKLNGKK